MYSVVQLLFFQLVRHYFSAVSDDFVCVTEAIITYVLSLVAVVTHGDVHGLVSLVDQIQQLAVTLSNSILVYGFYGLGGLECGLRGATGGALGEELGSLGGESGVGTGLLGKELGEDGDEPVGILKA